jgi:hypothetical protein
MGICDLTPVHNEDDRLIRDLNSAIEAAENRREEL